MILAERLKTAATARKIDAGQQYRELLQKSELDAADESRLLDCLQLLGRSIDQTGDDAALLARADSLAATVRDGAAGLKAESDYRIAIRAAESDCARAQQAAKDKLDRRRLEIANEFKTQTKAQAARTAESELSRLWGQLAECFGSDAEWRVRL